MNSVSSAYFFRFFAFVPILKNNFTNEFSRCRNGCKHSLPPKNGSEIAFQVSVSFLVGFETNVISVSIDKDVMAPNCVNNVSHIVVAF